MGRKIPGRKHRGIKDPEKQAARRLNSIKDKINTPPANPEVQEVSKTLQRMIDLKNKTKNGDFKVKKKKKVITIKKAKPLQTMSDITEAGDAKQQFNEPKFEQLPNESDRDFMSRVNNICKKVTKEAAFENKYGVNITRDATGQIKLVKRAKDELETLLKEMKKAKKAKVTKKKKKAEKVSVKLTKSQKWEKKKKEKKLKKFHKDEEVVETIKEPIRFGEVAHAPPKLTVPKKVQKVAPKTGKKKLLLSAIMENTDKKPKQVKTPEKDKLGSISNKKIDKKGKRKNLPNALRRQLEKQQQEVILAYKKFQQGKKTAT